MSDFFSVLFTITAYAFGAFAVMGLWAYLLASVDIFFGFAQENTGFATVTSPGKGDQLLKMTVVSRSRHLKQETVTLGGKELHTWVVTDGENPNPTTGMLGWLERHLGIYWIGWWPAQGRYKYEMFRTIFDRSQDASENKIIRKQDDSKFFYVQPVEYAFALPGAETGSALITNNGKETKGGGNIPVDVKFSVFLLIVYPEIALFLNPVWFERASSIILGHAKNYVGTRGFDALRSERTSSSSGKESDDSFAGYMRLLNFEIPGGTVLSELSVTEVPESSALSELSVTEVPERTRQGFLSELGVGIVGAAIRTVDIAGEFKEKIVEATTELYRKEQEAAGIRAVALARRDELKAELEAVDSSPNGPFVRRQRTLERASEKGQLIVFTGKNDDEEQRLTANLIPGVRKGENEAGEKNEKEK